MGIDYFAIVRRVEEIISPADPTQWTPEQVNTVVRSVLQERGLEPTEGRMVAVALAGLVLDIRRGRGAIFKHVGEPKGDTET